MQPCELSTRDLHEIKAVVAGRVCVRSAEHLPFGTVSRYGFRVRVWGLHEGLVTSGHDVTHCKSCVLSKAVLWTVCKEMEMENTGGNRLVHLYIHTYIHPFNGPFPGLPRWASTRKIKPIWILLKQETVSGSGICWATCISAPCSRQITMPAPHH